MGEEWSAARDFGTISDGVQHMHAQRAAFSSTRSGGQSNILTPQQKLLLAEMATRPIDLYWHVEAQLKRWRQRKVELSTKCDAWRASLEPSQRGVVGKLDTYMIREMANSILHRDMHYTDTLLWAFPVTGTCCSGGLGVDIPGGQSSHGRAGSKAKPIDYLRQQCAAINASTIKSAVARTPKGQDDLVLAAEIWDKTEADMRLGRVGPPQELDQVNLDEILLVESFGIWEHRGVAGLRKARQLHNFSMNFVNDCAYMHQKCRYDTFAHALAALRHMSAIVLSTCGLGMGKSDFKSAFKTLSPSCEQEWLCWELLFNPKLGRFQVLPLWSQVFGSVGAVVAWFRTARLNQHIFESLFRLVTFWYVDDVFWAATSVRLPCGLTQAEWIGNVFREVVSELLGWELDRDKERCGTQVELLGLNIKISENDVKWRLSERKRLQWIEDLLGVLEKNSLEAGHAAKFCGRFAFLNAHVFGRLGRALLRPFIWRQQHAYGNAALTNRLRLSCMWFVALLQRGLWRITSLQQPIFTPTVLLYTDAEGSGRIGAVAEMPGGELLFLRGSIPSRVKRMLQPRRTQIVAFELLAALVGLTALAPSSLRGMRVCHFIDSSAALGCVVRGFCKQIDLALVAGRLWFEAADMHLEYFAHFVDTKCNLADGPSRNDISVLSGLGAVEVSPWQFPPFPNGLGDWMNSVHEAPRVVQC